MSNESCSVARAPAAFFCVCVDARWPSARHTTGDNMSVNITFLGGADTVTGSRYLVSPRQAAIAGRLRLVPGRQAIAAAQLDSRFAGGPGPDRRGGADPCPPGPQRLPAASRQGRFHRQGACNTRPPGICARSCCPTAATSRKKTRRLPTATVSPNTRRHCRCTPATTHCACLKQIKATNVWQGVFSPIPGWFVTFSGSSRSYSGGRQRAGRSGRPADSVLGRSRAAVTT
jgi:hypothetical protein